MGRTRVVRSRGGVPVRDREPDAVPHPLEAMQRSAGNRAVAVAVQRHKGPSIVPIRPWADSPGGRAQRPPDQKLQWEELAALLRPTLTGRKQ